MTDMGGMFCEAISFDRNLADWNVSSVTSMHAVFDGARCFSGDLSRWDVSNVIDVTDVDEMLEGASNFNRDLSPTFLLE